jgi:hypothetical protein
MAGSTTTNQAAATAAATSGTNAGAGGTGISYIPLTGSGANTSSSASGMYAYQPKTVNITDLTQTSQPDIASIVNGAMLSLVGRAATAAEISQYGSELLAAQRANPGSTNTTLNYDPSTGKPAIETGTQLSSGVDATGFIDNIIRGTAEAQQYTVLGGYMDALSQATDKFKGSFNG